jgi:hypothetical protein
MSERPSILRVTLLTGEAVVAGFFIAACWMAPTIGPGAKMLVTGLILAGLLLAWSATWVATK